MNEISKPGLVGPVAAVAPSRAVVPRVPQADTAPAVQAPRAETARQAAIAEAKAEESAPASQPVEAPAPPAESGRNTVTGYSDPSSGRFVLQVRKAETQEVVSQYPAADLLRFYALAREALERSETADPAEAKQDVSA